MVGTESGAAPIRAAPRTNLPAFPTSFVGRAGELATVGRLLGQARLLTITGFGGIGKTRLAVRVGSEELMRYPAGVWIVRYSHLTDPEQVARTAADELGIPGRGDPFGVAFEPSTTLEGLLRYLAGKQMLLILDHCEHIAGAVGRLAAAILGRCPTVTLLATSQQPLRIPGERVWQLPELDLPAEGETPQEAARHDAVQLFLERATLADPSFRLDERTVPPTVRICRRLDGSPLAIELAAARIGVLDVDQIADRLDDRFRLLRSLPGDHRDHHETLEATVSWSYELLDPLERLAFVRLSVFPGSFTVEAAEGVIAGGDIDLVDTVDLLSGLIAKSVLMRMEPTEGRQRYRLPRTLRSYGARLLAESGDGEAVRRAHTRHYLGFAMERADALVGTHQPETLDAFRLEEHNLHAALEGAIEEGDAETALSLVSLLTWPWFIRGLDEGVDLTSRALALQGPVDPQTRSRAQIGAGFLFATNGRREEAVRLLAEARSERERAGDRFAVAEATMFTGLAAYLSGEPGTARRRFSEALVAFEAIPEADLGIAWCTWFLGWVARDQHRWDEAGRLLGTSLRAFRLVGDPFGLANALAEMGTVDRRRGNVESAARHHREALELFRRLGDRVRIAQVLGSLAVDARESGDTEAALAHLDEGLALTRDIGAKPAEAEALYLRGETLRRAGREADAEAALRQAFAVATETEEAAARLTRILALEALADLAARDGRFGRTVRLAAAAEVRREALGRPATGNHRQRAAGAMVEARSHLSDDSYRRLYEGGRTMDDGRVLASVLQDEDPTDGVGTAISLEQVELGERVAQRLSTVGERLEVRLGGLRMTGRRRRPTGEKPPLPIELRTSGWVWLALGVCVLGLWASLFWWPQTTVWWEARDHAVSEWLASLRTGVLTDVAQGVHALGSAWLWRPMRWVMLIVLAFVARRWRHFFGVLMTMAMVGWLVEFVANQVARPRPFVSILAPWQGYSHPSVPVAELGLTLALVGFTLIPHGRWRMRFLVGAGSLMLTLVAARVYLGVDHLTDGLVSAAIAPASVIVISRLWAPESVFPIAYRRGRTAHLDVGGARGRAIILAVGDQLGITISEVQPVGLAASGGSTPLRLTVAGDPPTYLFGKVYARNHLRADRWYKTGRTILYGALEDEVSFRTVRRLVEYEDYLLLAMRKAHIPSTRPYGIVEITPDQEYLIVTEFLEGGVEIDKADVDDVVIDRALTVVRRMWDEGLAHRDIKPGNVMVQDGEVRLVDVAFGLVRPTPWRQAVDLANMMLTLSLKAAPDRVYERALQFFAPEDIAEAFAATRGITVPRQLAAELRERQREDGVDRVGVFRELAPHAESISIQRWSRRRIGLAIGALMAGLLLVSLLIENVQGRGIL